MKFDTIIIGGGLSGLTCAIKLTEMGQKCAIISIGQSALHFSSGAFDLLGSVNGEKVMEPFEGMSQLPENHPYSLLGIDKIKALEKEVVPFFSKMGVNLKGSAARNHYRITPMGGLRSTWLSLEDFNVIENEDVLPWKKVTILNVSGYLDFYTKFIADELEQKHVECSIKAVSTPELERLRKSPTEMRAANIARVLESAENLEHFAAQVNANVEAESEVVMLPAVFGLYSTSVINKLRKLVNKPIWLLPTMPISVPGVRTQIMMRKYFQDLGGVYLLGDTVLGGEIIDNRVTSVSTSDQGDIKLYADNFVLASGSFFSHGLIAEPHSIVEPIFNLDTLSSNDRNDWFKKDLFKEQPYMSYGVKTNADFRASINGQAVKNLYVAGAVLGGYNPIKEACGGGVSILTAMNVANLISKSDVL
ncbi:MAG: anaerobic glycerol-3-phosphate dehydrogenase subunit GlpB [Marinifilaceae bacterium]